jgi:hypothetical protein
MLVYKYLFYIRRLLEMLEREESSNPHPAMPILPRNLLFWSDQTPDQPWPSSRLTSILKKAITEIWGFPVNSQLYRQLTIGTTEKHVQEVHAPFKRFDDKSAVADKKCRGRVGIGQYNAQQPMGSMEPFLHSYKCDLTSLPSDEQATRDLTEPKWPSGVCSARSAYEIDIGALV